MPDKKILVNYTNRDFNSIKRDLEEHARRYYPDTYKDFSENSFGSYILDTVSYVGDMLSFYLDYQVNESFWKQLLNMKMFEDWQEIQAIDLQADQLLLVWQHFM